MTFTTLAHHLDIDMLRAAFQRINPYAAPGVDQVTAKQYAEHLDDNLCDLYERLRSGRYRATPVKRVWLDKSDGSQRPIGKPVLEDKIVQRAVVMLLEAIYEQDFYDFSFGYRPERNPHQALHLLREQCMNLNIGWIIDADIKGFFDSIDHNQLREVLRLRVNDGQIIRLVGKWLNAGVLEGDSLSYPEQGTPQGGVISPLLANIFLHHILDEWFVQEVLPRMKGRCFLIRFADDFVIGCELEADARRVMMVLPKRFQRFDLTIHPTKTQLVRFGKPPAGSHTDDNNGTFDFLGFTHFWARSRRGYWVIKRQTAKKRLKRTLKLIWQWCRDNRHQPIAEQYKMLSTKLRGHFQYYAIRGNYRMLEVVKEFVEWVWRYWLTRRSRTKRIAAEVMNKLREVYQLPVPKILHVV
jgi:RNA-directed DNA polymerase